MGCCGSKGDKILKAEAKLKAKTEELQMMMIEKAQHDANARKKAGKRAKHPNEYLNPKPKVVDDGTAAVIVKKVRVDPMAAFKAMGEVEQVEYIEKLQNAALEKKRAGGGGRTTSEASWGSDDEGGESSSRSSKRPARAASSEDRERERELRPDGITDIVEEDDTVLEAVAEVDAVIEVDMVEAS